MPVHRHAPVVVALAIAISVLAVGAARADVREVEDVNDPILVPYQESVAAAQNSTAFLFKVIPNKRRVRITHVNCGVTMLGGGVIANVGMTDAPGVSATVFYTLPVTQQPSGGHFVVNTPISLVVDAGGQPNISMLTSNNALFQGGVCTVAGYEIKD